MFDESEILKLEAHLASEHEANLAAIRRVQRLLRERAPKNGQIAAIKTASPAEPVHHPELPINAEGTVESKILFVLQKVTGRFSTSDVIAGLNASFPSEKINPKTVSGVMFRNKDKLFRVIEEGRGRRKAIYEKM